MARKVVNRKELREEIEAAERAGLTTDTKKKKAPARTPAKRKSRAKEPVEVRLRVMWGVFNQAMKQVAAFEFNEKDAADRKATALNPTGKTPHFVRKVKQVIEEP
jgi:hypothetical protein